ncbi:phosphoribosylaminoimidazolesuccinocarboxamide synthase [Terribacillus saccharophilus]|uniref:phosphoribosylaminoimidazolesuccinocarboxamide synthase n=1 Tax=Terribacillus saccharophilus TaxID=361277 RepID=UPI000C9D0905|nr:phosphoribosylaminoimidazolesuccinocarboxamide synthase [Terribacillus goriensis]
MRGKLLYEGKAKQVFQSAENEQELVLSYKNDATAFNGKKKASFEGKGRYNNLISTHIFEYLKNQGISSHFIKPLSETEQLVKKTTIVPLEVVVRNVAAGSITRRLGIPEKTVFQPALTELYYKDDSLDDPIINDAHALLLTDVNEEELVFIKQAALEVNQHLQTFFDRVGLQLVDFKLEFGRDHDGSILLSDEISPDTCRLWDKENGGKMDKDVFREDLGNLIDVYDAILNRLEAAK